MQSTTCLLQLLMCSASSPTLSAGIVLQQPEISNTSSVKLLWIPSDLGISCHFFNFFRSRRTRRATKDTKNGGKRLGGVAGVFVCHNPPNLFRRPSCPSPFFVSFVT